MHSTTVTRILPHPASVLYRAWTTGLDTWFAEPDSLRVSPVVGAPFFFEVAERTDAGVLGKRHPHYGRFLRLEPNALVELTWVTGKHGTEGAETTLTVRLSEQADRTALTLTHSGFATQEDCDRHADAWPMVLTHLESKLAALEARSDGQASGESLRSNRSIPAATFIPVRSYPDLGVAVAWLRDALGCRERLRIHGHRVQLTLGDGAMVAAAWDASAAPATGGRPPATLMVRVANIDAVFARALSLGGTAVSEPTDMPYGERQATLRDPAGHSWTLTQTIADVDPAVWGGELVR